MSTLKVDTLQHRDGTEYILSERNKLINGDFSVAQRGTSITSATDTTNNDANYTLDRWQLFSDGNDVVDVTQETTTVPTNQLYAIALDVETANKKFGIAQKIEQKNCVDLIGQEVTLSFKAKVSATTNLDNVKCAIIAWDGTADSLTDDMISAWGSEGTDPTLATNYTYENTPANLNLTTSYATYTTTATIDTSGAKNVVVFIWSDVTTTSAGEFLYVTDVQLEKGPSNSIFERKSYGQQLLDCQRYLYRYDSSENTFARIANGTVRSTTCHIPFSMKVTMRSAPTLESISAASTFRVAGASDIATCTSIALNEAGKDVVGFNFVTASSSLGDSGWSSPNNTTSAFFNLSSEM
jgi:hypothetical protein